APTTNIPVGLLTAYLVITALTTVVPRGAGGRRLDPGLMLVALAGGAGGFGSRLDARGVRCGACAVDVRGPGAGERRQAARHAGVSVLHVRRGRAVGECRRSSRAAIGRPRGRLAHRTAPVAHEPRAAHRRALVLRSAAEV